MEKIILYSASGSTFNAYGIESVFLEVARNGTVRKSSRAASPIECLYGEQGSEVVLQLSSSNDSISISGNLDSVVEVAYKIKYLLPYAINATDGSYSFNFVLQENKVPGDLVENIRSVWGR